MSLPPPTRRPSNSPGATGPQGPRGVSTRPVSISGSSKASPLPLSVAAGSVAIGAIPLFLGDDILLETLGYLFAALIPILCVGWDAVLQRKGLADPNFIPNRNISRLLKVATAIGIAVAIFEIYRIASELAEKLGAS